MSTTEALLQYGALGVVAAVFLGLVSWTVRMLLVRFLRAFDALVDALQALTTKHAGHHEMTEGQHENTMVLMSKNHQALMDKLTEPRKRKGTIS